MIVHENKIPLYVGILSLGFGLLLLPFVVYSDFTGNETAAYGYGLSVIFGAAGLLVLLDYKLRRFVIDGNDCCYRTMFGRRRQFLLQEIGSVKITASADIVIRLYDQTGKKLLRLEGNMTGAGELLELLEKRGVPIDAESLSIRDAKAKSRREKWEERQKEREHLWKEHPYFYQTPQWVRRVRVLFTTMNVVGTIVTVLAFLSFDIKTEGFLYLMYPMFLFLIYLIFHRIILFEKPPAARKDWKNQYVKFPWCALCAIALTAIADSEGINFRNEWEIFLTALVIGMIPLLMYLLAVRRPRLRGLAVWIFCAAFVYGFMNAPYLHWICRVQPPVHRNAFVLEMEEDRGSSRLWTGYYMKVELEDGTTEKLQVFPGVFHQAEESDEVQICQRVSVFGVEYWYVHFK